MADWQPLEQIHLTAPELADILELDKRTVFRLVAEEGMPKKRRGEYPLVDCVKYYIRKLKVQAEMKGPRSADIDDDRRRLLVAQAEQTELKNAITRGEQIEADLVDAVLLRVAQIVATQTDAIGPRNANRLAAMTDPAEIILLLREEANAIRSEIAAEIENYAIAASSIEDDPTGADQDGGGVGRSESLASA